VNEDEEAELRRHGSGADGSLDWAAETGMSGRCELMRGPSEEKRGERSQPLPPGTGDAHEREKIKKSREIRRSGGQGVDLNGQRSGKWTGEFRKCGSRLLRGPGYEKCGAGMTVDALFPE